MASIHINGLKVRAIIGAHPWERKNKQELIVHVSLSYDAIKASKSDQLKDALDYEAMANLLVKTIEKSQFKLLEKLAAVLLRKIMQDKRVIEARIRLDKPQAIAAAQSVSVELAADHL